MSEHDKRALENLFGSRAYFEVLRPILARAHAESLQRLRAERSNLPDVAYEQGKLDGLDVILTLEKTLAVDN